MTASDCPLAVVYSRREAALLFHRFGELRFELNQITWRELFLIKPVARMAAGLFGSPSRNTLPARLMGWCLYIRGREAGRSECVDDVQLPISTGCGC